MKKLIKLQINSEKILKNNELIALKGGLGCNECTCYRSNDNYCYGYIGATTGDCDVDCNDFWGGSVGFCGNMYELCSNQPG